MLQNKIKRQPGLWKEEFNSHLEIFKKMFLEFREDPSKEDEKVIEYIRFMTHICDVYKKELAFLPTEFVDMLEQNYAVIHPNVRFQLVQSLRMIRTKKQATATDILPLFFRLFRAEDKALRSYLFTSIIGDLKIINRKAKATNVNKTLQNFVYNMIKDPQEMAGKKSLQIMIELYKKKIWNDDNTVNVIAEGTLQKSGKLCLIACKFFLLMNYDEEEDSDDDSSDVDNVKSKIMNTRIGAKMSRKKKHNLQKTLKNLRRNKDRKGKILFHTDFLPIDLIRCPQEFAEKLYYRLRKSSEKLEIKLHMMKLIGRLIGRHKLIMFNFYPYLSKYINTHQKELAEILAIIAESTHINVPHEEVSPMIEKILDNFVNERASPLNMTIAINAVREICARNPNAMNKEQLQYIIAYYKIKNKSVSVAIKGLINLFRDLRPELLEKKQLGKEEALKLRSKPAESMVMNTRLSTIDGIELLKAHEGLHQSVNMITHRLLTEEDFKTIKMLRLQQKAEKAKEQIKLNLKGYEIVDDRYKEDENEDEGEGCCEGEGEGDDHQDADDEQEESEIDDLQAHTQPASESKSKTSKTYNEDNDGEADDELDEQPKVNLRSDGITFVAPVRDDLEVDYSMSESGSEDEYRASNPHNFLDGDCLNTFKKTKYEKMAETYVTTAEKGKMKKERARAKHEKKNKSKTNKEKKKFKPLAMLIPKKLQGIQKNYRSTKERINELKTKLGKVKEGKLKVHRRGLKKVR